MKINLLLFVLFLHSNILFCQLSTVNEEICRIGYFYNSSKGIEAKKYIFDAEIAKVRVDTAANTFTVQLFVDAFFSTKRKIVYYDYEQKKVLWDKSYRNINQYFGEFDDFMYSADGKNLTAINPKNGQDSWAIKSVPYYISPKHQVIVGYENNNFGGKSYNTLLRGYSSVDGQVFWQRNISREYGWNDMVTISDSTYILAADGLHSINLKTGVGWNYYTSTGEIFPMYSFQGFESVKGDQNTLDNSNFHVGTANNLVYDVCSNIVKDTSLSLLYFASAKKIVCLDYKGNEKWILKLPKDIASKSNIFIRDSTLYVINEGLAHFTSVSQYGRIKKSISYGRAYIAAFNRFSGVKKYFKILEVENEPILDYILQKDSITIVHKKKLVTYNIKDGEKLKESNLNLGKELIYGHVGRHVFINEFDSLYRSIYSRDTTGFVVYTKANRVHILDNQLKSLDSYLIKQLYFAKEAPNGLVFLNNDKETLVMNQKHKIIAVIYTKEPIRFLNNKGFYTDRKNLVEFNLDKFLE